MRVRRTIALTGLLALPLLAAGAARLRGQGSTDGAVLFEDVRRRVLGAAIDSSLTADAMWEKAARGLVTNLNDPYAGLYSPAELASFNRNTLRNDYGGVGMQIQDQLGRFVVATVFAGSPAALGGVEAGDRIVEVDGSPTHGLKIDEVSARLVGKPGSPVQVTYERPGVAAPIHLKFLRARVHVPAVPYALMLDGSTGYIPLQRVNDSSAADVHAAITRLRHEGARSFVLDLRGNPGGSVEESVAISSLFLPGDEPVVTLRYRGQPPDVSRSAGTPVLADAPLVVLIDGNTASAAEIVAGALQDHDRALVVGTTSYGKGVAQSVFPLRQGWALKLTTAAWFTPSGRSIQRPHKADGTPADSVPPPDSLETDAARHGRPAYRSDAGRAVYGGGGITPDLIVPADTLTGVEVRFLRALAPQSQAGYAALNDYALELKHGVRTDFHVRPEWRSGWESRLVAAGVTIPPAQYDSAQRLVDRLLEQRVATLAFGDSSAFRRSARDDSQLQRALALLKDGKTQAALFAQLADRSRG
jgi:carboxyl-terminal processing protease